MNPVELEKLDDDKLRQVIERSQELLAERDMKRKAEAMEHARKTLESVGLTLNDLVSAPRKAAPAKRNRANGTAYRSGARYRNPNNAGQEWIGRGKKPRWLRELERSGGKAIEVTAP